MRSPPTRSILPIVLVLTLAGAPARAQQRLDASAVLGAIDRGAAFLQREQDARGRWDEVAGYEGGATALCTLALLASGLGPDDPHVARALDYLRRSEPDKTYCVALKAMALCAAEPQRDLLAIRECVAWLEREQIRDKGLRGAWAYPAGQGDPSNSQFAVLALHEAELVGVPVSQDTWRLADAYWRSLQNPDGSFSYPNNPASGSMTCAGIGALVITSRATSPGDARAQGGRVECCLPHQDDPDIARALDWLGRNFSVRRNPAAGPLSLTWHYYYLYGVERVGRMTAQRFIGEHDWYREGADYLVASQDPLANSWRGRRGIEDNPHLATAMALLFLAKGRRPVLMAKLQHGPGWDSHRRDAGNLTLAAERAWGLGLTWQRLDPAAATVEDLLQAPVLYVSGASAARLEPLAPKLRAYVDRGGFLLGEACCDDPAAFRQAFGRLVGAMFPEPEYRLAPVGPAHPLWRMERVVRPESRYAGRLSSVEYGCRTCVVLCEEDLSCYLELADPVARRGLDPAAARQVDDALDLGLNLLAYATGREPQGKEQSFALDQPAPDVDPADRRGVIQVAKLRHGGGCDDAPGALANLMRAAGQGEAQLRVATDAPLIAIGDDLFHYHLVFMHGRHDFRLTPTERRALGQYLRRGGTLLADSICASPEFTTAFRREVAAAAGAVLEQVPPDDPLLTPAFGGYDVRLVTLREPAAGGGDNGPLESRTRRLAPRLEGVRVDGRWRVLFSPFDLSCALEKHEAVQCRGYTREDAARLGLNVLLYSLNQ